MKKLLWTGALALTVAACLTACDDSSSANNENQKAGENQESVEGQEGQSNSEKGEEMKKFEDVFNDIKGNCFEEANGEGGTGSCESSMTSILNFSCGFEKSDDVWTLTSAETKTVITISWESGKAVSTTKMETDETSCSVFMLANEENAASSGITASCEDGYYVKVDPVTYGSMTKDQAYEEVQRLCKS